MRAAASQRSMEAIPQLLLFHKTVHAELTFHSTHFSLLRMLLLHT